MTLIDASHRKFVVPSPNRVVELTMSDGANIRLRQHGRPGRSRLAFSHGNGLAIDAYLPFWLPLADEFELVVFDVRNHGENQLHDPAAHNWDRISQDMGEIFDGIQVHFGKAPTTGVFHSLSAVATLISELDSGPRWSALALFDPPIFPRPGHPLEADQRNDMEIMTRRAEKRPWQYETLEQLSRQLARQPAFKRWIPGTSLLLAQSTLREGKDGQWVLRNPRELEASIYAHNIDPNLWPQMDLLQQPIIIIGADPACMDASPPARICRAIHEELGIDYAMIPDTTHFLQIERPAACRSALMEFLTRHGLA